MINRILLVLSAIVGIFLYGRKSAKDSIKNEQNEIAAKQIKRKNEIEKAVSDFDDDRLNELQKRLTRE